MTVTKKPDRRGEYDISRKTIARGMPGDFRCDLTNACAFYHYHCTRGYRAHRAPGIPCALNSERAGINQYLAQDACGEIAESCTPLPPRSSRVAGSEASKARSRGRGWGVLPQIRCKNESSNLLREFGSFLWQRVC